MTKQAMAAILLGVFIIVSAMFVGSLAASTPEIREMIVGK